jgi:hypothetical protein
MSIRGEEYYVSVSSVYVDGVMSDCVYFSVSEIDRIRILVDKLGGDGYPHDDIDYDKCDCIKVYDNLGEEWEVYKLSDEWYILSDNYSRYYKCDQFEGLVRCISDIFGNK